MTNPKFYAIFCNCVDEIASVTRNFMQYSVTAWTRLHPLSDI